MRSNGSEKQSKKEATATGASSSTATGEAAEAGRLEAADRSAGRDGSSDSSLQASGTDGTGREESSKSDSDLRRDQLGRLSLAVDPSPRSSRTEKSSVVVSDRGEHGRAGEPGRVSITFALATVAFVIVGVSVVNALGRVIDRRAER